MKIAIGMPTTGSVKSQTMFSVFNLVTHSKIPLYLVVREAAYVHTNREEIARKILNSAATHLLFIDSDMSFKPDALDKLVARDRDIIGASYNYRQLPLKSTIVIQDEKGNILKKDLPDGTFECAAISLGFALIKTSVFKKIPHPWFFYEHDDKGNITCGEDVWFCRKAKEAGFKIYCDPTIEVGHIGNYTY